MRARPAGSVALAVLLLAALPASAEDGFAPYETCNMGGPPPACTCADMQLVEDFRNTHQKARDLWKSILDSRPADVKAAQDAFAKGKPGSSHLNQRMPGCTKTLALANWFSPIYNTCYCEKTCDVLVDSTRLHEQTHSADHALLLKVVALAWVMGPAQQAQIVLNANRLMADAAAASEVHAHDEQLKYLDEKMAESVEEGCTWEPVVPEPPPPPRPRGTAARLKSLLERLLGSR
jgi:hypothetical protein